MRVVLTFVVLFIAAIHTAGAAASAPCRSCGPGIAGMETPCGETGCGPRYRGVIHEPSRPDPCDCCNRWRGCQGAAQAPEMLAPWQVPPGRGFMSAEDMGYDMRTNCRRCGR